MSKSGTIKIMFKKVGIVIALATIILCLVPQASLRVSAAQGYQYIRAIPDSLMLTDDYYVSDDLYDSASEGFPQGPDFDYVMIGLNCSGLLEVDGTSDGVTPDCDNYFYTAAQRGDDPLVFHGMCVINDSCGDQTPEINVLPNNPGTGYLQIIGPGSNESREEITIAETGDLTTEQAMVLTERDYGFDFSDNTATIDEEDGVDGGDPNDQGNPPGVDTSDDETEEGDDCQFSDGLGGLLDRAQNPLDWFGCAVVGALTKFIETAETTVDSTLRTDFDDSTQAGVKPVWDRFLNIANILFVVAFLIMVISTALGIGIIDAYTVKKLLPRVIVAVIIANLSFAVCSVAIEFVNAIGKAIPDIFSTINAGRELGSIGGGTIGATAGGGIAAALVIAGGTIATAGVFALLPVLLAVLLGVLVALAVVIVRRILIILLVVTAPIAIALWVIPGGEGIAKRWWKTFIQLLLVYPIILALIASGKLVASVIASAAGAGNDDIEVFEAIAILGALVAPFFMLPAVFKLANSTLGNITGRLNDRSKGLLDRSKKMRSQKMAQGWDRKYAPKVLSTRANLTNKLQDGAAKEGRNRLTRGLMRAGARGVGGYNIEAAMSARNAQESKIINEQIATGKDDEIRALSVNKKAADRDKMLTTVAADGHTYSVGGMEKGLRRLNSDGTQEYRTLAGAWVNETNVEEANRRWGNNQFAQQASLSYEMRKAMTDDQVQGISDRYAGLATEQWGLNENQAAGNWIGAGFENQNQHIEYKNTSWQGKTDGNKLAREVYEKKGSYPLSQMSAHTITKLGDAHDEATAALARGGLTQEQATKHQETIDMVGSVSETFMQRGMSVGRQVGMADDVPVPGAPPTLSAAQRQAALPPNATPAERAAAASQDSRSYGSGSGHMNERINWLASKTGRFEGPPTTPHPGPDASQSSDPSPGTRQ